jgi:hypothetical protein
MKIYLFMQENHISSSTICAIINMDKYCNINTWKGQATRPEWTNSYQLNMSEGWMDGWMDG